MTSGNLFTACLKTSLPFMYIWCSLFSIFWLLIISLYLELGYFVLNSSINSPSECKWVDKIPLLSLVPWTKHAAAPSPNIIAVPLPLSS